MRSILLLGAPTPEKLREVPYVHARSPAAAAADEPDAADLQAWPPASSLAPASGRWRRLESEFRAPASIFGVDSAAAAAPFARQARDQPAGVNVTAGGVAIDEYRDRFAGLDEVSASFALHTAASFDHSFGDADTDAVADRLPAFGLGDDDEEGAHELSAIVPPTPRNLTSLHAVASRCRQGECVSIVAAVISVAPARQVSTKFGTTATLCVVKLGTSWPSSPPTATAAHRPDSVREHSAGDVRRLQDRATTLELTLWDDATSLATTLRERDVVLVVDACVSRFKNKPGLVSRGGGGASTAATTTMIAGAEGGVRRRGTTCSVLARLDTASDRALPVATRARTSLHRYPYQWLAEEDVSMLTGRVVDRPDSAGSGDDVAELERHIVLAVDYVRRWLVPAAALEPPSFTSARGSFDHTMATTTDDTTHDRYTQ